MASGDVLLMPNAKMPSTRRARRRRRAPIRRSPARSLVIIAGLRFIGAPVFYLLAGAGLLRLLGY